MNVVSHSCLRTKHSERIKVSNMIANSTFILKVNVVPNLWKPQHIGKILKIYCAKNSFPFLKTQKFHLFRGDFGLLLLK